MEPTVGSATEATGDNEALKFEYEALVHEAATLSGLVARRRADLALLRAESATVAVSLEKAKEDLQGLLRSESIIRMKGPMSPDAHDAQADFLPDQGLVRSLTGQLEVTKASIEEAEKRRQELVDELKQLEGESGASAEGNRDADVAHLGQIAVPNADVGNYALDGADAEVADDTKALPAHPAALTIAEKRRSVRNSLDQSLLRVLKEDAGSKSSYRSDHAHIWRDGTMPNLALVSDLGKAEPKVSLGVVTERIFEGVTCFSPTGDKNGDATEQRIEGCGTVQKCSKSVFDVVVDHFGALSVGMDEFVKARILAPKVALDRVLSLVGDSGAEKSSQPLPKLPETGDDGQSIANLSISHPVAASDGHSIADLSVSDPDVSCESTEAASASSSRRLSRRHDMPPEVRARIAPRLSHASHVLQADHFSQIMADGVPARFHESNLNLIYSTNLHGMSLHTLYNRVKTTSPTIIAIRDTNDCVFGCYAASPWKSSATRYYGTGESFVFGSSVSDSVTLYKWSRSNSFFQFTSSTFLAIGGGAGSHFALWIDEDLLMGTTSACSTFGNPPLTNLSDIDTSSSREFKIISLEVWGFVPHVGKKG